MVFLLSVKTRYRRSMKKLKNSLNKKIFLNILKISHIKKLQIIKIKVKYRYLLCNPI
jgi:hypothetical protein